MDRKYPEFSQEFSIFYSNDAAFRYKQFVTVSYTKLDPTHPQPFVLTFAVSILIFVPFVWKLQRRNYFVRENCPPSISINNLLLCVVHCESLSQAH